MECQFLYLFLLPTRFSLVVVVVPPPAECWKTRRPVEGGESQWRVGACETRCQRYHQHKSHERIPTMFLLGILMNTLVYIYI